MFKEKTPGSHSQSITSGPQSMNSGAPVGYMQQTSELNWNSHAHTFRVKLDSTMGAHDHDHSPFT
jgi:hypothetical protein